MKRVLVTGGSGFIGMNLLEKLKREGAAILNYDWRPPLDRKLEDSYVAGDILDASRLEGRMRDFAPDAVVHLAARCDLDGKTVTDYDANITGVENVIGAVRKTKSVKRVVFASSRYVHRTGIQPARMDEYSPFTAYGASKVQGEAIVRKADLDRAWVIVRPTSIWGPWFGVPYRGFFDTVRRGLYMHPGREKLYKTYGYVGNVVHELVSLLAVGPEKIWGKTLYLADYEPVEVGAWAEMTKEQFGAPKVRRVPPGILKGLALTGDLCKKAGWSNPPLTSFRLNNLREQMRYDMSATSDVVGPLPYTLAEGVASTVAWMRRTDPPNTVDVERIAFTRDRVA